MMILRFQHSTLWIRVEQRNHSTMAVVICHYKPQKEALQNFLAFDLDNHRVNFSSPSPLFKIANSSASCREFNSLQDRVITFLEKKCLVVLFY